MYQDQTNAPGYIESFCMYGEFETNRKYRVKSSVFGCLRIAGTLICLACYGYYCMVWKKTYLEKAVTSGFARMTLQHPVLDGCNPLDRTCQANFVPKGELPYCNASMAKLEGKHRVTCEYLDEFNIFNFNNGADNSNFLIPTRISVLEQTLDPDCRANGCAQPYTITSEEHSLVADIENFTLLIDHSFVCEDHEITGTANSIAGFLRKCERDYDTVEEPSGVEVNVEMEGCPTYSVDNPPDFPDPGTFEKLVDEYDSLGVDLGVYSIPLGDIMKVSKLMEIAGIDLDRVKVQGDQTGTVRYEGEVVIVEIHYRNYKEGQLPNSLPSIYEYRIYRLPTNSYKMTEVLEETRTTRRVRDIHGIHVQVRVLGMVGKMSYMQILMSLIGGVGIMSILSYIITCCAFNCIQGAKGDEFFNKVHQEMDLSHAHGDLVGARRFSYADLSDEETET